MRRENWVQLGYWVAFLWLACGIAVAAGYGREALQIVVASLAVVVMWATAIAVGLRSGLLERDEDGED
jgi:cation transport ATPase